MNAVFTHKDIALGDVRIQLLGDAQGHFLGLGEIRIKDRCIRDGKLPIRPSLATPEGIRYSQFGFVDAISEENGVTLRLSAFGRWERVTELWTSQREEIATLSDYTDGAAVFTDELRWRLRPVETAIAGRRYSGFSSSLVFHSAAGRRIHRLTMYATYELGGTKVGNRQTTAMAFNSFPAETAYALETGYNSAAGCPAGNNAGKVDRPWFQLSHRFAEMQSFDFQWNKRESLVRVWERPGYIRSFIQTTPGRSEVVHLDEYCGRLSSRFEPIPCLTLLNDEPASVNGRRDEWTDLLDAESEKARRHYGIAAPVCEPDFCFDWIGAASDEEVRHFAEHDLPALAAGGFRTIYLGPFWEYERNAPFVCSVADWRITSRWRDNPDSALALLTQRCRESGVKVIIWINQACYVVPGTNGSPTGLVFVRDQALHPHNGGYDGCHLGNLSSPATVEYFLEHFHRAIRTIGPIDGWFIDSFSNFLIDPIDYGSPDYAPMMDDAMDFVRKLLVLAPELHVEAYSPFGLPEQGIEIGNAIEPFTGDGAYTLYKRVWATKNVEAALGLYYRAISGKAFLRFKYPLWKTLREKRPDVLAGIYRANLDYHQVKDFMFRRHLRDDGRGVEWLSEDGCTKVFFVFEAYAVDPGSHAVLRDVTTGEECACGAPLVPRHVYLGLS